MEVESRMEGKNARRVKSWWNKKLGGFGEGEVGVDEVFGSEDAPVRFYAIFAYFSISPTNSRKSPNLKTTIH